MREERLEVSVTFDERRGIAKSACRATGPLPLLLAGAAARCPGTSVAGAAVSVLERLAVSVTIDGRRGGYVATARPGCGSR